MDTFSVNRFLARLRSWITLSPDRISTELALTTILLLGLTLILSQPAIKTLRTVEVAPDEGIVILEPEQQLVTQVTLPSGEISYYVVWIIDQANGYLLSPTDYESLRLTVHDRAGEVVRVAEQPRLIRRDELRALSFYFEEIVAHGDERYTLVIEQTGSAAVRLRAPLAAMIKSDERVATALQLGEKKTWAGLLLDKVYQERIVGKDISYYHHRGTQIVEGINPYACVTDPDEECTGYPSHLPGLYVFAAGVVGAGVDELDDWAGVWRLVMLAAWLGIGIVLLVSIYRLGYPALAVVAMGFWLFNRWTLSVLRLSHTDFVGVFLLLGAVIFAQRRPLLGAVLLGTSLAIKQVAILIVPLYLIYVWRTHRPHPGKLLAVLALLALVPVATAVPFLLDNPEATVQGWLTTATRAAQTQYGGAPSLDHWLDVTHAGKSTLLLFLTAVVYVAAWRRSVDMVSGTFLLMALVVGFTHVLFHQYVVWLMPFVPLVAAAYATTKKKTPPMAVVAQHEQR